MMYRKNTVSSIANWRAATALMLGIALLMAVAGVFTPHSPVAAQGISPTATATPTATSPPIPTRVSTAPSDVTDDEAQPGGLFTEIEGDPPPSIDVETLASRFVGIDFEQLSEAIESPVGPKDPVTGKPANPQTLVLNLFDDVAFTSIVEHVEPTASGHALWGGLEGVELGTMTLVVNGSVVVGTVRTLDGVYTIRTAGDGKYVIRQIDESTLPPLGEPLEDGLSPQQSTAESDEASPDDGSMIDVMVVYTPLAKHQEGGRAAIEALIDLFVTETNQAFWNSDAPHRVRLVFRDEVQYTEYREEVGPGFDRDGGSLLSAIDLYRLRDESDGYMDHIHELRDLYAADLVHILTGIGDVGGVAYSDTTEDESHGFALTLQHTSGLVFAHELGHNLGLRHDRYQHLIDQGKVSVDGSNYGYVNQRAVREQGSPKSTHWRTIMSYPTQCAHADLWCQQIQYFSNPDLTYNDDPLGVPVDHPSTGADGPADAVGTLEKTRQIVANYRRSSTSAAPRVGLALSPYWLDENGGASTVTATLHRPSSADTTVTVSVSSSDAVRLSENTTLTIPAGRTTSAGVVTLIGVDNGNQSGDVSVMVSATAANVSDEGVIGPEPVELAIADDETTPVASLSLSPVEIVEFGGITFVTATLDSRSSAETTVTVSTSPAAVVEIPFDGEDILIIPAGQTTSVGRRMLLRTLDDDVLAPGNRKSVTVSGVATNPRGVTGPESVTLTILDDEAPIFAEDSVAHIFTAEVAGSRFLPEAAYGDGPLTYSISPTPDNGVTFAPGPPARIGISARPAPVGMTAYTLTATDIDGDTDTMTISVTIRSPVCPNSTAVSGASTGGLLTDCDALLAAMDSLTGTATLNWSADTPIAEWDGVVIGGGRVTHIQLGERGLNGEIPGELANLTNLRVLDLGGNQLTGQIPAELGNLTNLRELVLWGNQLTGQISAQLGSLANLGRLSLSNNRLSGEIPSELGNLANLDSLNLGANKLTGPIPPALGDLTKLTWLNLDANQLTGSIPTQLGSLTNLQALHLDRNQLTGTIPSELGNLADLQRITLKGNQLTGCIPDALRNVGDNDLDQLELPFCSEHPCVSAGAVADATNPGLSADCDALLAARDTLESASTLNWSMDTPIADWSGVVVGGTPRRVIELRLSDQGLDGEIPPELGTLAKLQHLNLSDNQLTGGIPTGLGDLDNLQELYLGGNQLAGCIPDRLRDVSNNDLHSLGLSYCSEHPCLSGGAVADANNLGLMSDCETLLAALDTLAGTAILNWATDTLITQWDGVVINRRSQRVTGLSLHQRELTGEIPAELGSLSNLQTLDLSSNQLMGEIPPELGDLSNLVLLSVWGNQLTGEIPKELGNLSNLQTLWIDGNQLTGELPESFTGLTALDWLHFHENSGLCAPIDEAFQTWLQSVPTVRGDNCAPEEESAEDRAVLVELYNSTGGANWTDNTNWLSEEPMREWHGVNTDDEGRVAELFLERNEVTGEIPIELSSLSNLTRLILHTNQLAGEIPTELGNLSNLTGLSLSGNQLTGEIPTELGSLSNLTQLFLSSNQLTGEIPADLGNLSNLTTMSLWENQLSGEIPADLGNLSNLQWLTLHDNQLTGELPQSLTGLTVLSTLSFNNNAGLCAPIDEAFQIWLLSVTSVRGSSCAPMDSAEDRAVLVELYNATDGANWTNNTNWLSDRPIREWHGVINDADGRVSELLLGTNELTGEIPTELGSLSNLTRLYLHRNQLTGEIPTELANLSNLTHLYLNGNQLTGEIPAELGNLSNLTRLYLYENQLTGEIPAELGNLSNLTHLILNGNQLTGEIPVELGNLSNLTHLILNGNQLTGEIPVELGNLTGLSWLYLADNQFTGCLREELRHFSTIPRNDLDMLGLAFCADLPGAPMIDEVTAGTGSTADSLLVKWSAPASEGASALTAYDVRYIETAADETDDSNWTVVEDVWTTGGGDLQYTIAGFSMSTQYDLQVRAVNDAGDGPWSETVTGTPMVSACVAGGAVTDGTNIGLIADCQALLAGRDTLTGTATLNWATDMSITQWEGVGLGGTPRRVTRLNLAGKGLGGMIPVELGRLSMLTHLNLRSNDGLTGEIPNTLGNLGNLRVLNLHSNSHTGAVPDLRSATRLEELYLPNNADYDEDGNKVQGSGLTGQIPTWLNDMTNMRELWLWGNDLNGSIPDLSGMTSLDKLKLANNMLTGGVPAASQLPPNMTWLIIDRNPLGGTIPDLSSLTRLKLLWLHSNDLEGSIPAGSMLPESLDDLNLRDNMLTGTILDLSNLDNLTRLRLHNNSLSGEVPATLGDLDSLKYLWLHNEVAKGLGNNSFTSIAAGVGGLGDTLIVIALNGNPWAADACVPAELANVARNDYVAAGLEVCSASSAEYYTQFGQVDLIQIKASDAVSPEALTAAANILGRMMDHRPDIAERLSDSGGSLAIIPTNSYITELPEFRHLSGELDPNGNPYDSFAIRGAGGIPTQTTTATAEENLLDLPENSTRFWDEDITVHEWAHAIENIGFDDQTRAEWLELFHAAREANLFPGTFGLETEGGREFFAEMTQAFFGVDNRIQQEELRGGGPVVTRILNALQEVYGPQEEESTLQ